MVLAVLGWVVSIVHAAPVNPPQPSPGFGQELSAHGWVLVEGESEDSVRLLHLGPRLPIPAVTGSPAESGVPSGRRQLVRDLGLRPEGLAAVGDRVFLVLPPERTIFRPGDPEGGSTKIRRVLSLGALPTPVAPLWYFVPPDRLDPHPALPGEGDLIGFAGGERPSALLQGEDGALTLRTLGPDGWVTVPMPTHQAYRLTHADDLWLVDGPAIVFRAEDEWFVALPPKPTKPRASDPVAAPAGAEPEGRSSESGEPSGEVGSVPAIGVLASPEPSGPDPAAVPAPPVAPADWAVRSLGRSETSAGMVVEVLGVRDAVLVLRATSPGILTVTRRTAEGSFTLGTIQLGTLAMIGADQNTGWGAGWQGEGWVATTLDGGRRLVVLVPGPPPPEGHGVRRTWAMAELSTTSGVVMYEGPATAPDIVSSGAMKLLLAVMMAMMVAVLLVAVRRDPLDGAVPLPTGVALAGLGRRAVALLIDVVIAFFTAAWGAGVDPFGLLRGMGWFTDPNAWTVAPNTVVYLWVLGVVGESMVSATPGKVVMGCRVVGLGRRGPGQPLLFQDRPRVSAVFLRNTLKVLLPPLLLMALLDPSGRHRAEQISGTAVVVRGPRRDPDEPAEE